VVWTVLGFTVMRFDNYAHGGGLVAGLALGAVFVGTRTRAQATKVAALVVYVAGLAGLLGAAAHRWPGEQSSWEAWQEELKG
jgi:hypothetical protein